MNKEYLASEYRRMHSKGSFSGGSLTGHLPMVRSLIKQYKVESLLDYGCGKAMCHKNKLCENVTLYDPYYAPYEKLPQGTFDMVICTDVLEHIPEDEVGKVLASLLGYTKKVLFVSICTKPANKKFRNGENVHVTVKPKEWWDRMLNTAQDIDIVKCYT